MTWEEVCADPSLRDLPYKIELNQWGNIEMRRVTNRHGMLKAEVAWVLRTHVPEGVFVMGCAIETAENVKVADVAWTSFERYDAAVAPDDVYTYTAPEICVEIFSASDLVKEQMHKGRLYLQAGAVEFWLCNELGEMRFFDATGPLERSRLCPAFPVKVEGRW